MKTSESTKVEKFVISKKGDLPEQQILVQTILALKFRNAINHKEKVEAENDWYENHKAADGVPLQSPASSIGLPFKRRTTIFEKKMNMNSEELGKMDERRTIEYIINAREQEQLKQDMIKQVQYQKVND